MAGCGWLCIGCSRAHGSLQHSFGRHSALSANCMVWTYTNAESSWSEPARWVGSHLASLFCEVSGHCSVLACVTYHPWDICKVCWCSAWICALPASCNQQPCQWLLDTSHVHMCMCSVELPRGASDLAEVLGEKSGTLQVPCVDSTCEMRWL